MLFIFLISHLKNKLTHMFFLEQWINNKKTDMLYIHTHHHHIITLKVIFQMNFLFSHFPSWLLMESLIHETHARHLLKGKKCSHWNWYEKERKKNLFWCDLINFLSSPPPSPLLPHPSSLSFTATFVIMNKSGIWGNSGISLTHPHGILSTHKGEFWWKDVIKMRRVEEIKLG